VPILIISTIALSVIAILSALRLQQLKDEKIAPTAPEKAPAQEISPIPTGGPVCFLSFTIPSPTPTNTPTPTPTPTNIPTPTPTVIPECWDQCDNDGQCPSSLECVSSRCANPDCPEEEDCLCPQPTPTPTSVPTSTPTPIATGTPGPTSTPAPTATPTTVLVSQDASIPVPTRVELPEAGVIIPSQLLIIVGSIISLLGLLIFL